MNRLDRTPPRPGPAALVGAAALALAALLGACSGEGDSGASRLQPPPVVGAIDLLPETPWVQGRVTATTGCTGLPPLQYEWRFGSAAPVRGSEASMAHVFAAAGAQEVSVRCIDANGQAAAAARRVTVDSRNFNSVAGRECTGRAAGHGWCRQRPVSAGTVFAAAAALDRNHWWGIDWAGRVQRSDDGGSTWRVQLQLSAGQRAGFAAPTAQQAWTIGAGNGIWHTTDGGRSWQRQWSVGDRWLEQIWAVNDQVAWAAGDGLVLRTVDGGATWRTVRQGDKSVLSLVAGRSAETAWLFDAVAGALATSDGGATWRSLALPAAERIVAVSGEAGSARMWALSRSGELISLGAGDTAWALLSVQPAAAGTAYSGLGTHDGRTVWLSGWRNAAAGALDLQPVLRRSLDGGRSWTALSLPVDDDPLWGVAAVDGGSALLLGSSSLQLITPAGTAVLARRPDLARLNDVHAFDANTAFAVGEGGSVVHTSDGGLTWTDRNLPLAAVDLYGVLARAAGEAWAVGRSTQLWRTTNAGRNWLAQALPTTRFLNAIARADADLSWIVGDNATVLKSSNDGQDWTALTLPDDQWHLAAVAAPSARLVWVVGHSVRCRPPCESTLFVSRDAGGSWQRIDLPGVKLLREVAAPDPNTVWALGIDTANVQQVWRSTDAGASWSVHAVPGLELSVGIAAIDGNTAWVGGWGGVQKTTDGGAHWTLQAQSDTATIRMSALQALDGQTLWAAGLHGDLWKTLTAGD